MLSEPRSTVLQVIKWCGYCSQDVDLSLGPHVHDPKICRQCGHELSADRFPSHSSSCDGRRHVCDDCIAAQRAEARTLSKEARDSQRKAENERLRAHGYRWARPEWHGGRWSLLDPKGAAVEKSAALQAIELTQGPIDEPDDLSVLWEDPFTGLIMQGSLPLGAQGGVSR